MLFTPNENEGGQGLLEYGLVIVLVAVVVLVILVFMGPTIANIYTNIVLSLWGG
jgi:pilus assembly protein Flp/PilA